jgi:hypothetical protein
MEQTNGKAMEPVENDSEDGGTLELHDHLIITLDDGTSRKFEIVGILEDEESQGYAVAFDETAEEFIVTDAQGNLLEDEELAQEILDNYQMFSEESAPEQP